MHVAFHKNACAELMASFAYCDSIQHSCSNLYLLFYIMEAMSNPIWNTSHCMTASNFSLQQLHLRLPCPYIQVAQLVERLPSTQIVAGSNPAWGRSSFSLEKNGVAFRRSCFASPCLNGWLIMHISIMHVHHKKTGLIAPVLPFSILHWNVCWKRQ